MIAFDSQDGPSIVLFAGERPAWAKGLNIMVISDYELSDEAIVTRFSLRNPTPNRVIAADRLPVVKVALQLMKQRLKLTQWPNGIECLVAFDDSLIYPKPKQLLRAYKTAFAARAAARIATRSAGQQ